MNVATVLPSQKRRLLPILRLDRNYSSKSAQCDADFYTEHGFCQLATIHDRTKGYSVGFDDGITMYTDRLLVTDYHQQLTPQLLGAIDRECQEKLLHESVFCLQQKDLWLIPYLLNYGYTCNMEHFESIYARKWL